MSNRKRSSCASGNGYVPSCSIGFCVASTKNGSGRRIVWPLAVTLCSCIASSSAAWVRGGARLISSARTMLAKTGPRTKRKARPPDAESSSKISEPVMSLGTRSGVNWIRRKSRCTASASERTMSVLARPGTPTSSAWPPATSAISISSSTRSCPTTRRCTSPRRRAAVASSASRFEPADAAGAAVMWEGRRSADRAPAAVREEENRPVDDAGVGERRGLVENLPTAQLDHEILVHRRLGKERLEGAHLDGEHGLGRRDDDADDVPDLGHLDANRDRGRALRRETDRRWARAQPGDERRAGAHSPAAGGSVEKNRAICMSNR